MFRKRGFTLIELLVVIAIIALLASIVLANLANARAKADMARMVSEFRQMGNALAMYYDDNGFYPSAGTSMAMDGFNYYCDTQGMEEGVSIFANSLMDNSASPALAPTYISQIPGPDFAWKPSDGESLCYFYFKNFHNPTPTCGGKAVSHYAVTITNLHNQYDFSNYPDFSFGSYGGKCILFDGESGINVGGGVAETLTCTGNLYCTQADEYCYDDGTGVFTAIGACSDYPSGGLACPTDHGCTLEE